MAGNKYLHYQHSLGQSLKPGSRFGWQHIATLLKRHNTKAGKGDLPDELMNQGYLTVRLHPLLSLKGGLFYTNAGGYQPSMGIQFFFHNKNCVVVVAPRAGFEKKGAYELFTMMEYTPPVSKSLKLYIRLQAMSNASRESHNRSYQLVRVGVDMKGFQAGGGLTLDEYGTSGKVHSNAGLFVRRSF